MSRGLVPVGFEAMSHPIFKQFSPPTFSDRLSNKKTTELNSNISESTNCNPYYESSFPSSSSPTPKIATKGTLHSSQVCSICVEWMENPVTIVKCSHSYCFVCLTTWYKTKQTCPLCNHAEAEFVKFATNTESGTTDSHHIEVWQFRKPKGRKKRKRIYESVQDSTIGAIDIHQKRFLITFSSED